MKLFFKTRFILYLLYILFKKGICYHIFIFSSLKNLYILSNKFVHDIRILIYFFNSLFSDNLIIYLFIYLFIFTVLSGGPLMDDVYKLEQYHCHWGCSDSRGSEHTVNGQAFAGEVSLFIKR